jgi:hypothetical protein
MPVVQPFNQNQLTIDGNLTLNDDGSGTYGRLIAGNPGTAMLALQATTGSTGYTLVNNTGNIITWTAPNDGVMHRVMLVMNTDVSSSATGGQISISITSPNSASHAPVVLAASQTAAYYYNQMAFFLVAPNTSVTLQQTTALTAGAALLWAEIWAS